MKPVKIIREADDPLALRASIGGDDRIGHYLVYRGDPDAILDMLHRVVAAFELERKPLTHDFTNEYCNCPPGTQARYPHNHNPRPKA